MSIYGELESGREYALAVIVLAVLKKLFSLYNLYGHTLAQEPLPLGS